VGKIFSDFYKGRLTSRATLEQFVPAVTAPCEYVSLGGEGLGGRSALVAYPADNLIVVIVANARGGDLVPYARRMAELVGNERRGALSGCRRN
jgi:hypothetical protein